MEFYTVNDIYNDPNLLLWIYLTMEMSSDVEIQDPKFVEIYKLDKLIIPICIDIILKSKYPTVENGPIKLYHPVATGREFFNYCSRVDSETRYHINSFMNPVTQFGYKDIKDIFKIKAIYQPYMFMFSAFIEMKEIVVDIEYWYKMIGHKYDTDQYSLKGTLTSNTSVLIRGLTRAILDPLKIYAGCYDNVYFINEHNAEDLSPEDLHFIKKKMETLNGRNQPNRSN